MLLVLQNYYLSLGIFYFLKFQKKSNGLKSGELAKNHYRTRTCTLYIDFHTNYLIMISIYYLFTFFFYKSTKEFLWKIQICKSMIGFAKIWNMICKRAYVTNWKNLECINWWLMPSSSASDGRLKETQSFSKTSTLEDTQILPVSQPNQNTPLPHRWHSDWARRVPDKDLWPANYWRTSLFPDPPAISPSQHISERKVEHNRHFIFYGSYPIENCRTALFRAAKRKVMIFYYGLGLRGRWRTISKANLEGFLIHQMGMMAEQLVALYLALIGWSLGGRLDKWKSCEFGDNSLLNECLIEIWKLLGD